jgi:hypothetical protein
LTLNIVAPPAGTGFTFGDLPTVTIPADGTVVPVSIAVTPLTGSTATITLQSNSTLPPGINATISGHTLILSAAAGVPAGDYYLDLIGNDGGGNTSHGRCPVHVGGSGDGFGTPYLIVPSRIGVPNNGQPTRIGPYWILSIGGLVEYYTPPATEVTPCSAGAGITANIVTPSQSDPSNIREFDIIYTANGTAPGDRTVTCTVLGQYSAAPVPPAAGVSVFDATVYDATPQIQSVTPNVVAGGQDTPVTIQGNSFGTGTPDVRVCDWTNWPLPFPTGSGPCAQSGDWTVGNIHLGVYLSSAVIEAVLHAMTTASGHYCLQVTSRGANGNQFVPAPNAATSAWSGCLVLELPPPSISLTRQSLTQFTVSGYPSGGTFSYGSSSLCLFNCPLPSPTVGYAQGVTAQANPNAAVLANPTNPCPQQVPCQGSLSIITAYYMPASQYLLYAVSTGFQVATFGMSCYYTAAQQDWGTAPDSCGTTTINHVNYSGYTPNPPGLPAGNYCNAFLAQLRLQGSAALGSGTLVQYDPSLGYYVVDTIKSADGSPAQAGRTVARDRTVIPRGGVLVDINGVGNGLLANDVGSAIQGYRIDYYSGAGISACTGFNNIMAVSGCNPGNANCPASAPTQ